MLVKIARIDHQPATEGQSPLPTQQFVLFTAFGRIVSSFSIDMLQRCYPPPESAIFSAVDVEIPDTSELEKKRKITLRRAYKMSITQLHARTQVVASKKLVSHAMQVAQTINAKLTEGVESEPTSSHPLSSLPPLSPSLSPSAAVEDDMVYPCTHCRETLPASVLTFCMYIPCKAPFHTPRSRCRQGHRVQTVDGVLLYCCVSCAKLDVAASRPAVQKERRTLRVRK